MNDADFQKWIERSWNRPLTPEEEAELRGKLGEDTPSLSRWEEERQLNRLIQELPEAEVPSNFTAQVLQALDRETSRHATGVSSLGHTFQAFFRLWMPRFAVATLVAGLGITSFLNYRNSQQHHDVALGIENATIFSAVPVPAETLEDFEAIRYLAHVPDQPSQQVDMDLLAALE